MHVVEKYLSINGCSGKVIKLILMKKSFTLVELIIVVAILAVLSAIAIFTLNPARLFDNFRDSRRISDITAIHKAIVFMEGWNSIGISYGSTSTVYISVPDTDPGCANIVGLPTLSAGYSYACKPIGDYKKSDGNGWLPINFLVNDSNYYLNLLPVDPVNDSEYFYAYFPGGSYELLAKLKNPIADKSLSESANSGFFALGSPNRENGVPMTMFRSGPEPLIHDGYTYTTLELPSGIIWMKDNMRSANHSSGTSCCMNNNSANCATYGRLYTRGGAMTVCPSGWSLPTDDEWKELEGYFGMNASDQGSTGWRGTGIGTTMKNDFNISMSGYMLQFCGSAPTNYAIGEGTAFWTTTCSANCYYPYARRFRSSYTTIERTTQPYYVDLLHVRCVKRPN